MTLSTMTTTPNEVQSGLGLALSRELVDALSVDDLQKLLDHKQQEARFAKFERRNAVSTQLAAAQEELDRLDQEMGRTPEPQPRPGRGGMGSGKTKRCVDVLRRSGKPMSAGEIAAAAGIPSAAISNYLRHIVARGEIAKTGDKRFYRYQWTGGKP